VTGEVDEPPSHVSLRAGFTWYFLPIGTVARIRELSSFEEFNAVVASVFLDTFLGGKEVAEPIYNISAEFFNVAPAPEGLAETLAATDAQLIHHEGRFHYAGRATRDCLSYWKAPAGSRAAAFEELKLANAPPLGEARCGFCSAPLCGEVFALEEASVSPYQLAVCVWCAGCLPVAQRDEAIRTTYPRTLADSFPDTPLLALLEADVEAIKVKSRTYFRVRPKNGEGYFVEAAEGHLRATPPCLRVPQLRDHRVTSLGYSHLASMAK